MEAGSAESYALLREGLDRAAEGEYEDAILAYEQAVLKDQANLSARVNLAITRARYATQVPTAEVIARLKAERDRMMQPDHSQTAELVGTSTAGHNG